MSNFKNCPFCDSEKVSLNRDYDCESGGTFYSIRCDKCRASSGSSFAGKGDDCPNFYAGVANDWNSQALRDQIEKLKAVNSDLLEALKIAATAMDLKVLSACEITDVYCALANDEELNHER